MAAVEHVRALENRIEQLEGLRNVTTNNDFYERLAAGKYASTTGSTSPGNLQYIPVPITLKAQLGSPTALAIGAFATTLTTLSLALMEFRGLTVSNAFIGDFFGVAGIGMVLSAIFELLLGNTYAYTVLASFGLFYAGFGFIITPFFGVAASFEGGAESAAYNNALGFFVLMWAVLNLFFLIGSLPLNLVYIGIFFTARCSTSRRSRLLLTIFELMQVQMAFTLVSATYFLTADNHPVEARTVKIVAGAFAFASGMLGFYTMGNLMCQEALRFSFPMGDTSRLFRKRRQPADEEKSE